MTHTTSIARLALLLALPALIVGCTGDTDSTSTETAMNEENIDTPTNRIDINAAVRRSLGITFAEAEVRRVEQTLRIPGRFEYKPSARREYRTMLPGRVELHVDQFQDIRTGDLLYTIEAPQWRDLQKQLSETEAEIHRNAELIGTFDALFAAHEEHEASLRNLVEIWNDRIARLEAIADSGGGRAGELTEARAALAAARSELAETVEKDAALTAQKVETTARLRTARERHEFLLESAALILDRDPNSLAQPDADDPEIPTWRAIRTIEVHASTDGVVESLGLTNGAWADERSAVLTVVDPTKLRFHASGLQSDLGVLRNGLRANIVPPTPTTAGRAIPMNDTMAGSITVGLMGDADDRTIELLVTPDELADWARPGVAAQLEVVTDETARPALAIPRAAVQWDGLSPVVFRRAPDNPDQAIRIDADLGLDDGRWVIINTGLRKGDQVVLDGGFQLMLATSTGGQATKGGHFHADGTFHAEDH